MSATERPDAEGPELEVLERDDGTFAVVRRDDRSVLSTHDHRAGAEAELFRLTGAGAGDAEDADEVLTDTQGAHPGNSSD